MYLSVLFYFLKDIAVDAGGELGEGYYVEDIVLNTYMKSTVWIKSELSLCCVHLQWTCCPWTFYESLFKSVFLSAQGDQGDVGPPGPEGAKVSSFYVFMML